MKIYTKTGDTGQTSLFSGKRVPKHHLRVDAYGQLDELNAHLGHLRDGLGAFTSIQSDLLRIQHQLFVIGSHLAFEPDNTPKTQRLQALLPAFDTEESLFLEHKIDTMQSRLPAMTHFILPGGHPLVSSCHIVRTVCRRAERGVTLLSESHPVDAQLIIYLNRLSDYLFVLSRFICKELDVEEVKWIPKNK